MTQQVKKQRQLDPAYWIVHENRFGKKVYLYEKPNQSIIIPTHQEIHEFEANREAKMPENAKQAENGFNLRTKPPTNLTKAQKAYEQKKMKDEQISFKKTKTAIHHDSIPSIISDQVFTECFSCIDKNHELNELKLQKLKLSRQYQQKIQLLKRNITKLQKYNQQLLEQNQNLKKQNCKKSNQQRISEYMQNLQYSTPKLSNQSQISRQTSSSSSETSPKEIKSFRTQEVMHSSQICELYSSESVILIDEYDF